MLNKQRSHRRNSWKFAVVLPLLAAFMMAFQVKTVAREKQGLHNLTASAYGEEMQTFEITKDTDDETLKKQQALFKDATGADVTFTNVKRNDKGEITSIRIEFKGTDNNRMYDVDSSEPITPIIITIEKDGDVIKDIQIAPAKRAKSIYVTSTDHSSEVAPNGDTLIVRTHKIITSSGAKPVPPASLAPLANGSNNSTGQNVAMNISDNTLIVVNGVKQPKGAPVNIPHGQQISAVNVIKGKDAKKKYGKEAKDGAIEITTIGIATSYNGAHIYRYGSPALAESTFSLRTDEMPDFDFEFDFNAEDSDGAIHMQELKKQMEELSNMSADVWKDFESNDPAIAERISKIREQTKKASENHFMAIRGRELSTADKEQAEADRAKEKNYRLDFISEKIKMELYKDMQEMEKARHQMEKVLKELDAERAKYKAEKAKATRKA